MTEEEIIHKVLACIHSCNNKAQLKSAFNLFLLWQKRIKIKYGEKSFNNAPIINYAAGKALGIFESKTKQLEIK